MPDRRRFEDAGDGKFDGEIGDVSHRLALASKITLAAHTIIQRRLRRGIAKYEACLIADLCRGDLAVSEISLVGFWINRGVDFSRGVELDKLCARTPCQQCTKDGCGFLAHAPLSAFVCERGQHQAANRPLQAKRFPREEFLQDSVLIGAHRVRHSAAGPGWSPGLPGGGMADAAGAKRRARAPLTASEARPSPHLTAARPLPRRRAAAGAARGTRRGTPPSSRAGQPAHAAYTSPPPRSYRAHPI